MQLSISKATNLISSLRKVTIRNHPGNALVDTDYTQANANSPSFIGETRENDRYSKGYNGSYGLDWNLNKSTNWSNSVNYRKSSGDNQDNVTYTKPFFKF